MTGDGVQTDEFVHRCENHPEQPAGWVATMPSPERPYERKVPLCTPCADRIRSIGPWPVLAIGGESHHGH